MGGTSRMISTEVSAPEMWATSTCRRVRRLLVWACTARAEHGQLPEALECGQRLRLRVGVLRHTPGGGVPPRCCCRPWLPGPAQPTPVTSRLLGRFSVYPGGDSRTSCRGVAQLATSYKCM